MGEFKGTPGPLIVHRQPVDCRSGDGLDHSIQTQDGDVLALVALVDGSPYDLDLWAAAPDLLEAVYMYRDILQYLVAAKDANGRITLDQIEAGGLSVALPEVAALIARATGSEEFQ